MVATEHSERVPDIDDVRIRNIDYRDLKIALMQGWEDFKDKRGDLIFLGVLYPIICFFAIMSVFEKSLLPLLFPLIAGGVLLGPAIASGFYELARRREEGRDSTWRHFFDVMLSESRHSLIVLTTALALIFLFWITAAWMIYAATLGPDLPPSLGAFISELFTTREGWTLIILGNLVGLLFAIFSLCFAAVSFPMLVDKPVGWDVAVRTSFRAARHNPVTMAIWGLIVAGLLLLGTLTALLGLAIVLPVLGYATWHLYTRVVER